MCEVKEADRRPVWRASPSAMSAFATPRSSANSPASVTFAGLTSSAVTRQGRPHSLGKQVDDAARAAAQIDRAPPWLDAYPVQKRGTMDPKFLGLAPQPGAFRRAASERVDSRLKRFGPISPTGPDMPRCYPLRSSARDVNGGAVSAAVKRLPCARGHLNPAVVLCENLPLWDLTSPGSLTFISSRHSTSTLTVACWLAVMTPNRRLHDRAGWRRECRSPRCRALARAATCLDSEP